VVVVAIEDQSVKTLLSFLCSRLKVWSTSNSVGRDQRSGRPPTRAKLDYAAGDLRYILGRGYPRKSAVRFVCDHYRIGGDWRVVLSRVVFDSETVRRRTLKLVECDDIHSRCVGVDGFNVLIGVEAGLIGEPIFRCDDSFVRDIRGVFRNYRVTETSWRALDEIVSFLADQSPAWVEVLFDVQIGKSGELSARCREKLESHGIEGICRTSKSVDFELKHFDGVVATSDGIIIDEAISALNIIQCVYNKIGVETVRIEEIT